MREWVLPSISCRDGEYGAIYPLGALSEQMPTAPNRQHVCLIVRHTGLTRFIARFDGSGTPSTLGRQDLPLGRDSALSISSYWSSRSLGRPGAISAASMSAGFRRPGASLDEVHVNV